MPISLSNVPICTQGMQRTWWPAAGTIIVTGPYCTLASCAPWVMEWSQPLMHGAYVHLLTARVGHNFVPRRHHGGIAFRNQKTKVLSTYITTTLHTCIIKSSTAMIQCATFPIDRGPALGKNWVGRARQTVQPGGPTVYGDFMCFTLWQHSRSICLYCRSMVNHLDLRPVVYDFCKHYFAHWWSYWPRNKGRFFVFHSTMFDDAFIFFFLNLLINSLWPADNMVTQVTTGSGNGLVPTGTKPLPEPMLTSHQWGPLAFSSGQFHRNCSRWPTTKCYKFQGWF